jgi:hypothetical protein
MRRPAHLVSFDAPKCQIYVDLWDRQNDSLQLRPVIEREITGGVTTSNSSRLISRSPRAPGALLTSLARGAVGALALLYAMPQLGHCQFGPGSSAVRLCWHFGQIIAWDCRLNPADPVSLIFASMGSVAMPQFGLARPTGGSTSTSTARAQLRP